MKNRRQQCGHQKMGGSLEAVPLFGMLAAVLLGAAAGLAHTGWLMKNSTETLLPLGEPKGQPMKDAL